MMGEPHASVVAVQAEVVRASGGRVLTPLAIVEQNEAQVQSDPLLLNKILQCFPPQRLKFCMLSLFSDSDLHSLAPEGSTWVECQNLVCEAVCLGTRVEFLSSIKRLHG